MLDIGKGFKLVYIKLGTVKPFFYIFRLPCGVRQKVFKLNEIILLTLTFIQNFSAAVNTLCTIFTGHADLLHNEFAYGEKIQER